MATFTNLIPIMTSETTPSGVASESNYFAIAYNGWHCMDESSSTLWGTAHSVTDAWVQYEFAVATPVNVISISIWGSYYLKTMNTFQFLGSNTGAFAGEETILLSQSGLTGLNWNDNPEWEFEFDNSTAFKYYRLHGTVSNDTQYYIDVLQFGYVAVQKADAVLKLTATTPTPPPTQANLLLTATAIGKVLYPPPPTIKSFTFVGEIITSKVIKNFHFVGAIKQSPNAVVIKRTN